MVREEHRVFAAVEKAPMSPPTQLWTGPCGVPSGEPEAVAVPPNSAKVPSVRMPSVTSSSTQAAGIWSVGLLLRVALNSGLVASFGFV